MDLGRFQRMKADQMRAMLSGKRHRGVQKRRRMFLGCQTGEDRFDGHVGSLGQRPGPVSGSGAMSRRADLDFLRTALPIGGLGDVQL